MSLQDGLFRLAGAAFPAAENLRILGLSFNYAASEAVIAIRALRRTTRLLPMAQRKRYRRGRK